MNKDILSKIYILILLICCPFIATAQTSAVSVNGIITDKTNEPLIGASIVVEGTQTGTVTDLDGKFQLNVPVGKSILITYTGFIAQKIEVKKATTLTIVLEEDAKLLQDIVVFGYGKMEKKDLTGSIQTINTEELQKSMATNVTEALNGRVSGVLVTKTSNRPGADMTIQIRGKNSINNSNEPLYVIDGVPSQTGMRHLNSSDIESIDILKDASSSAIYGSRGANGVVIVTTKGANKTKGFTIDYNGSVGISTPTRIPDMIGNKGNGLEYVDYKIALWKKKYGESSLGRSDFFTDDEKRRIKYGEYYDWLREISDEAITTNHSISASGNSEQVSYTFGLGYTKNEGMIGNEDFERITANLGLEYKMSNRFKMGLNSYISINNTNHGSDEALLNAYFLPPVVSPYGADGEYTFNVQPTSSKYNPFVIIDNTKKETDAKYTNFSGFVEFVPVKDLTLKSQIAVQYDNSVYGEWLGTYSQAKQGVSAPDAYKRDNSNMNYVWDNTATYDATFNKVHKVNLIGLFSAQKDTHKTSEMKGEGLPYDSDWHAIGSADQITGVKTNYWESSMLSFMGRANYIYNDRYLFTATGRYDGSSRLAKGNRWGFMPSFAAGWRVSEEEFMKSTSDWLSNLKLRVGWGKSGNNNMDYNIAYSELSQNRYYIGDVGVNGYGLGDTKGNSNLKWEMTSEWNYGIDLRLFNSRVNLTLDYYNRETVDLILNRSVGSLNGYKNIKENIGVVGNKGFEIGLNTTNISTKDFTWTTNASFSLNRNKIKDLYGDGKDDLANRWFIGESINSIYDYKMIGIWQESERDEAKKYGQVPGQIKVQDLDENGVIDERDYQIVGRKEPDWTMGITNTFNYKDWDFSFYIYSRYGGTYNDDFTYMFTAWDNEHWNKLDVEYWTPENGSNKYPQIGSQSYYTQVLSQVKGSFLKIQNITLGYTLPSALSGKWGIKHARVYGNVQNPFTFTSYKGPDPEIIGENISSQLSLYPMTFTLGVNVTF